MIFRICDFGLLISIVFFNTKTAYNSCISPKTPTYYSLNWKAFWKFKIHERIKVFTLKLILNSLPIRDNLSSRLNLIDNSCYFCLNSIKTTNHLFKSYIIHSIWINWSYTYTVFTLLVPNLHSFLSTIFKSNNPFIPSEITHMIFLYLSFYLSIKLRKQETIYFLILLLLMSIIWFGNKRKFHWI